MKATRNDRKLGERNVYGVYEHDLPETKIRKYEAFLKRNKGAFYWDVFNELRHYYYNIDLRRSHECANIICEHAICDQYIVTVMRGWELDKDKRKAAANLLYDARVFPEFKYLSGACLLAIGDIYASASNKKSAQKYFEMVLDMKDRKLGRYHERAKASLKVLDLVPAN